MNSAPPRRRRPCRSLVRHRRHEGGHRNDEDPRHGKSVALYTLRRSSASDAVRRCRDQHSHQQPHQVPEPERKRARGRGGAIGGSARQKRGGARRSIGGFDSTRTADPVTRSACQPVGERRHDLPRPPTCRALGFAEVITAPVRSVGAPPSTPELVSARRPRLAGCRRATTVGKSVDPAARQDTSANSLDSTAQWRRATRREQTTSTKDDHHSALQCSESSIPESQKLSRGSWPRRYQGCSFGKSAVKRARAAERGAVSETKTAGTTVVRGARARESGTPGGDTNFTGNNPRIFVSSTRRRGGPANGRLTRATENCHSWKNILVSGRSQRPRRPSWIDC